MSQFFRKIRGKWHIFDFEDYLPLELRAVMHAVRRVETGDGSQGALTGG